MCDLKHIGIGKLLSDLMTDHRSASLKISSNRFFN